MASEIAAIACVVFIGLLFVLNRERDVKLSAALWLPVAWLFIGGTRNVSEWLQLGSPEESIDRYMEGNPVDRNALAALLIIGILVLIQRAPRMRALIRANIWVIVYFAYCGISVVWSDYPYVGFKRWIRSLGDLVMVLVILSDKNRVAALKRAFGRVSFVVLPMSILFIRYFSDLGRAYGKDGSVYWTGAAQGKNGLGMICLMFGLPSLWQFLELYRSQEIRNRKRKMAAHASILAMAAYLLSVANSKTSLVCFSLAGGLMIALTLSPSLRRPIIVRSVAVALISASFAVLFLGIGGGALKAIGRDPTLTGRTDVWREVLQYAENPLIGAGYESFWMGERLQKMALFTGGINQAHNGYVEIYLNLGLVGVTLLGVLILLGFRRVFAAFQSDPNLSAIRIAFFITAVIYNFTEGSFKMMSPVWIGFLLAVMSVPKGRTLGENTPARLCGTRAAAEVETQTEQLLWVR